jgi:hypothetical protein
MWIRAACGKLVNLSHVSEIAIEEHEANDFALVADAHVLELFDSEHEALSALGQVADWLSAGKVG